VGRSRGKVSLQGCRPRRAVRFPAAASRNTRALGGAARCRIGMKIDESDRHGRGDQPGPWGRRGGEWISAMSRRPGSAPSCNCVLGSSRNVRPAVERGPPGRRGQAALGSSQRVGGPSLGDALAAPMKTAATRGHFGDRVDPAPGAAGTARRPARQRARRESTSMIMKAAIQGYFGSPPNGPSVTGRLPFGRRKEPRRPSDARPGLSINSPLSL